MNELERHIEILLLSNDCVIVPDFGGFMAHHVDARYDGRDSMFLPPLRTVGFNPQLKLNDSLLAQSYVEAYDISYPEAIDRLAAEVAEILAHLENNGKYEFNNIGTLYLNEDGNYSFEPCEAGILTPKFYGLGGVEMLPLNSLSNIVEFDIEEEKLKTPVKSAQEEAKAVLPTSANTVFDSNEENEDSENTEFILIKKSWLRNLAAACIALIAFFALSTPLRTPNIQTSRIDTGLLTRVMPKEMVSKDANTMKLNVEQTNKAKEDMVELKSAKPYYAIVLASRVTKRNAANYVETLQAKGLKEAKVVITPNNVKVVYGNFNTSEEAYKELNRLHKNEVFADSWITKVTE